MIVDHFQKFTNLLTKEVIYVPINVMKAHLYQYKEAYVMKIVNIILIIAIKEDVLNLALHHMFIKLNNHQNNVFKIVKE